MAASSDAITIPQGALQAALARELFHRTSTAAPIGLLGIVAVLFPHWQVVDHGRLLLWAALIALPLIGSAVFGRWALKALERGVPARTLVNWECLPAGLAGVIWGLMPLIVQTGQLDALFYYRLMLLCITIVFLIPTMAHFVRVWTVFAGSAWAVLLLQVLQQPYVEPMGFSLPLSLAVYWCMTFGMAQVDHRRTWLAMRDTLTIKALSESLAEREQALQERVKEQTAELRRTVESLREREALLSNSQQLAKVGYFVYDPEREVFRTSPQLDDILGLRPDGSRTLEGWRELVHPEHRERVWAQMMTQLRDTQSESEMMYPVQRRTDGAVRWVRSRSQMQRDAQGRLCAWFGNMQDITEQKEAEEKVHQLAFYDPLTQLANRRRLQELLPRALQTCQQDQTHGALMVLDLDNFKVINDTRGHAVGDQLLVEVAQRISANVRGGDTASRLGGDEFVVLAQGLDPDPQAARAQSMAIAEQLRLALSQPYLLNGLQFYCSTSIGVTLLGGEEQDAQTLLSQADLALYRAKAAGRNAIMCFDAWMQAAVAHKAALEEGLRHAIERRELVLHYQPQVDHDGRIAGAEALVRWVTSAGRSVSPAEFIPLAEESELILHIGAWVLDTGCAQLCRWQSAPSTQHLRLAINVSARQLLDPDFPQLVAQTIERHQVRPAGLKLELTENLVMGDLDQVVRRMHQLRQLGLGFSLDDFGTGYSSLSYLRQLPLDQLKIDQSFVRDLKSGTQGATILQAIVNLGTSLELEIIAEGVETLAQRQFLADCGCTLFQGYLFARPLPIEQFPTGPLGLDGVSP